MPKIAVCDKCGKICKRGEYIEVYVGNGEVVGSYVSNCCDSDITFYDNIKEIILENLED